MTMPILANFAARLDWMVRRSNTLPECVHCHLLLNLSDPHKSSEDLSSAPRLQPGPPKQIGVQLAPPYLRAE
jgi:hypothetical protein